MFGETLCQLFGHPDVPQILPGITSDQPVEWRRCPTAGYSTIRRTVQFAGFRDLEFEDGNLEACYPGSPPQRGVAEHGLQNERFSANEDAMPPRCSGEPQ